MKLTPKQERFVNEYLKDLNATQAAIRAGYSPKTAGSIGHELLKKPEIAAHVKSVSTEATKELEISMEKNLSVLKEIAYSVKTAPLTRIKAIEVINKMKGYDAPIKSETSMSVNWQEGRSYIAQKQEL